MSTMNPADEFPHPHPGTPNWTESFMFQAYSAASDVGCFFHVGRASWGDPGLWLERLTVNLPNGVIAVSGAYRRGRRTAGGGTDACYADCMQPYGRWKVGFDAAVQLTSLGEMVEGRLRMGLQKPLKMELDWRPTGPIWDQRNMKIDSLKSVHYEQAGWMSGFVEVEGTRLAFEGPGRRDRSWGVRDFSSLEEHTIVHGEFPEANVAFATAWFRLNNAPDSPVRGYIAHGQELEEIVGATLPSIELFSPRGTSFPVTLMTRRSDLRISGKVLQDFTHTLIKPNGIAVGADLESEDQVILWGAQVQLELGEKKGFGFMERSAKAPRAKNMLAKVGHLGEHSAAERSGKGAPHA